MSEVGHAFSQPGVSRLDGMLTEHKGWRGGRGRWVVIHGTMAKVDFAREGRTAVTAQGAFLLETGSSGHMRSSQGDKRLKTA